MKRQLVPRAGLFFLISLCAFAPLREFVHAEERASRHPLKGDDAKRADDLESRIFALKKSGEFAQALALAKELTELRVRVQGKDYWEAADARRDLETLQGLTRLPEVTRREYAKVYAMDLEATRLREQGMFAQAERLEAKILELRRQALGEDHPDIAMSYNNLAYNKHRQGKMAESAPLHEKAFQIRLRALGENHPVVGAAYNNSAHMLEAKGKYKEAQAPFEKAAAIFSATLGENASETAHAWNSLATNQHRLGNYPEARRLYQKALDLHREARGEDHIDTGNSYLNLGFHYLTLGRHGEAEPLLTKALIVHRRVLGEEHPNTAICYSNLGMSLVWQGKHAEAQAVLEKTLHLQLKAGGEKHPHTGAIYVNLGHNLHSQGKYEEAQPLLEKALQILTQVYHDQHPECVPAYLTLATNLAYLNRAAEALPYCEKALATCRRHHGEKHPDTANCCMTLANHYAEELKLDKAQQLYEQALDIWRQAGGELHPQTAACHGNLAMLLTDQRKFREAEPHYATALEVSQKTNGESHLVTMRLHGRVAMNLMAQGKHREAEPHWKQAARSYEAVRLLLTSAALDRAMIGAEYSPLPGMAVCLAANGRPAEAWQALELNLARGLLDEARSRRGQELTPVQLASQQKLKQQVNELRPRILSLLVKKDSTDADQKQLQDLLGLRSQAEDQLGLLASEISQQEALGLKQIQKHLPSDAALVVWLDVRKRSGVVSEHWSCVVRATGAPIWVRLSGSGPNGAWSEADLELVERLRRTLLIAKTGPATNGGGDASVAGLAELRARLRQLRLDPLRPHLQGVRRLFVVPIGAMTHIPLEAITDEFTVSYVPSGTQLVKLQQRRPEAGALAESLRAERSLMALADPNFGTQASNPGEGAALRSALWKPLPGSAHEVQAISSLFAKPTVLTKSAASEQKLEALRLSGELAQFKVLHIATHGLAHQTRSFESALILSQDALPDGVQRQLQGKKPIDGRLTAREVLDDWKLNAELVVLSACESALGRQGGGEGLLGFSQAFLLAGSRSVILSLWQVDDAATALLMTRFYENWLGQGRDATGASRPHIPKAEALREAKQWLRNLTREEAEKRIAGLPETARGLKLVPKADSRQPIAGSDKPFEHPFYWSAFVLIGDPN